ncbi:MAG: helix-turn-helix domain-containing protein [Bdellovibrionales bacterium]
MTDKLFGNVSEQALQKMTERITRTIHRNWYEDHIERPDVDRDIIPFLDLEPSVNWLEKARNASLLSNRQVAERMGVQTNSYVQFENNEERVSLLNLKKCSEAMDCELIYAIRPRQRVTFGDRIWMALIPQLNPHAKTIERALQSIEQVMYDPRFRRLQGWRKNTGDEARAVYKGLKEARRFSIIPSHPF